MNASCLCDYITFYEVVAPKCHFFAVSSLHRHQRYPNNQMNCISFGVHKKFIKLIQKISLFVEKPNVEIKITTIMNTFTKRKSRTLSVAPPAVLYW